MPQKRDTNCVRVTINGPFPYNLQDLQEWGVHTIPLKRNLIYIGITIGGRGMGNFSWWKVIGNIVNNFKSLQTTISHKITRYRQHDEAIYNLQIWMFYDFFISVSLYELPSYVKLRGVAKNWLMKIYVRSFSLMSKLLNLYHSMNVYRNGMVYITAGCVLLRGHIYVSKTAQNSPRKTGLVSAKIIDEWAVNENIGVNVPISFITNESDIIKLRNDQEILLFIEKRSSSGFNVYVPLLF